jgi:hypothetical protein
MIEYKKKTNGKHTFTHIKRILEREEILDMPRSLYFLFLLLVLLTVGEGQELTSAEIMEKCTSVEGCMKICYSGSCLCWCKNPKEYH